MTITRNDTNLLKGPAIVAIVLHNFCHWIPGAIPENEYNFRPEYGLQLVDIILNGGPHLVMNLFSHYGCYGVPVFLFLSGFGMVRKYENDALAAQPAVGVWRFTAYNALKLWRIMVPGLILLFLWETFFSSGWRHGVMNVVYMLTFVTNFMPQTADTFLPKQDLLVGPWWYFSLTMQMYVLYRLAYYRRGTKPLTISMAACVLALVLAYRLGGEGQAALHYMRYTFLGCLLPFAFGVAAARYDFKLKPAMYAVVCLLFLLEGFNWMAWIAAPLALVMIVLPVVKIKARAVRLPIEWVGSISAALFVVHPVVRCFLNPRTPGNLYVTITEYFVLSILAAWLLTLALKYVPKPRLL